LCPGMWLHFQGRAYYQLRRYEEAENVLKRRIFRTPETDASRALLAATYGQTGRLDEAREQWRESFASTPPILWNTGARCCPTRTQPTSRPSLRGSERRGWLNRVA
jgi:adenylate cyclase